MFRVLTIASAFVGVIVGAGFASGQEILQYFTSFGHLGTFAALISTVLFAYLGMILTKIGSRLQTISHREAIYEISGRYLGVLVDIILIFTLFGVGVVMIAGAGSTLEQQFGIPNYIGSLILTALIVLTMMLKVQRVVAVIGSITPFLLLAIVIIAIYSLFTMDTPLSELNPIAQEQKSAVQHWIISGINYASFNIAVGAGMAIVMGAAEKDERIATLGGFFGGLLIGILILLAHFAIFSKIDVVATYDLPLLKIVEDISPTLAVIMAIIIFGMIFNTGAGMFYAFIARFFDMENQTPYLAIVIIGVLGYIASFIGFTDLVGKFYRLIGYLGLFLVVALIYAPIRMKRGSL